MLECRIKKKLGNFTLDVDITANDGVTALLGASGSGKSMILKCIAGIIKPDSGLIRLGNVTLFDSENKINLLPRKRHTGFLFQDYALFPNMTIENNIYCGTDKTAKKSQRKEKVKEIAEIFRISPHLNKYPYQLSGGEKQRSALARIFAGKPDILMLDEPFSALDSHLRWELETELTEIFSKFKKTVLYVSHNRNEVYRLCDNITVLNEGKSLISKGKKELFDNPEYVQAAKLTGCKNIIKVEPKENMLYVPDWNTYIECKSPYDVNYIGIRANHIKPLFTFNPMTKEDKKQIAAAFPFEIISEISDTFTDILMVRRKESFSVPLRWEMSKEDREILRKMPQELVILKKSILYLR
ncbi:MAG: ATP-binding cassette domain-containing protein [Oscillospiraceae bacterium]|jgi:molybdate transport system ATP-binding protein|nr:ATP-binding cassette domain-containing protein [Oscillospiraceae bacterium]